MSVQLPEVLENWIKELATSIQHNEVLVDIECLNFVQIRTKLAYTNIINRLRKNGSEPARVLKKRNRNFGQNRF